MSVPSPAAPGAPDPEQLRRGRRTLLLLLAVSVAPVLLALFAFYVWRPAGLAVNGQLIDPPQALALDGVESTASAPLADAMRGKWVIALRAGSACADACREQLYLTRQIRTLQAKEMDRVLRLWVIDDEGPVDSGLLAQHPDLLVVRNVELAKALGDAERVVLIDPQAFLMMRYPAQLDPKGVITDLKKLLKYTR